VEWSRRAPREGHFFRPQASTVDEFVECAAEAYAEEAVARRCVTEGARALRELYDARTHLDALFERLRHEAARLALTRRRDWTARILWSQHYRATDYRAQCIELRRRETQHPRRPSLGCGATEENARPPRGQPTRTRRDFDMETCDNSQDVQY